MSATIYIDADITAVDAKVQKAQANVDKVDQNIEKSNIKMMKYFSQMSALVRNTMSILTKMAKTEEEKAAISLAQSAAMVVETQLTVARYGINAVTAFASQNYFLGALYVTNATLLEVNMAMQLENQNEMRRAQQTAAFVRDAVDAYRSAY
jgi:phosphate uptake regulator